MIPKIIHYCWFGGNELPQFAKKCIESWRIYFPNYEIKEWNESNFDINCCTYVKEAYAEKKYAFVSDYARFYILYNYGGVYFDTDVEVIKSFEDILEKGQFMGCEVVANHDAERLGINPGLGMAAEKGDAVLKRMLQHYEKENFLREDKQIVTIVKRTTDVFSGSGYDETSNIMQKILDYCIYPTDYFAPLNILNHELNVTENTHSIHNYSATWITKDEQKISSLVEKSKNLKGVALYICKVQIILIRLVNSLKIHGLKNTIYKMIDVIKR